jgi:hypothetical protein
VYRLSIISRFWNRAEYHSREKPLHTALESPALKEKMISRKMGKYKNRKVRPINRRPPIWLLCFTTTPPFRHRAITWRGSKQKEANKNSLCVLSLSRKSKS